uniref:Uncharacterized protein n=1 Tax=Ananas comosus var. bracteatus TaxID=296719 RepID=A0A6V7QJT5_ANACO|nr:unnamed protein product [Ananas comosus var. bracteatus]
MFYQSSIRNQRAKSSKVKRILQFTLLLGVSLWLLYQMKHSHDKKAEYEEVDRRRISQLDRELYLGRKEKAGYESELEIDNHEKNFDEINEISKTDEDSGAQPHVFDHDGEEKDEENISNKENAVLQEAEKEKEQHSNEDDKTDSYSNGGDEAVGNGTSEETEETLKLPSQDEDGNNYSDQDKNSNEVDGHDGQNFSIDGENSDDAPGKVSNEENILTSADQIENVSLPEDQSKLDVSSNEEVHVGESGESTGSNDSESETTNKKTDEEVDAAASKNKQPTKVNPSEENNSMPTFNDTSSEQAIEPQRDNVNANSEYENHEMKTAELQSDNNSDVVTTINDLSEEAKTGNENNVEMATKDGALDSKLVEPEGNNDVNAITEVATNNGENKEEEDQSASKEGDSAEKVGENASEVENVGDSSSNEPENNKISNTVDSSSSHPNEEDILERKANESSNGESGEKGDGVSTVEDTDDNNAEEIKTEWKPEDETSSESGSNLPLSGDSVKEGTGQEGHTE